MFIDEARILIRAGHGGNGAKSFQGKRKGKPVNPDGGSGGRGGSVIIKAGADIITLNSFRYNKHFTAGSGKNGGARKKKGANGGDLTILVPPGTVIYESKTHFLLRDLNRLGDSVVAARGGRGGEGNSRRTKAKEGERGEDKELILELKLVVDVGIVSLPNAGKSTLISQISHARPKIAGFPFTTKIPALGVFRKEDFQFIIVEIPALTLGAHENRGLGNRFLKHVERAKVIIHLIDISLDISEILENFSIVNKELKLYGHNLIKLPQILVASKMDLPEVDKNLRLFKKKINKEVYPISALQGKGINELTSHISEKLRNG